MINKQNLWFVTLFSLILVLGIYYVSIDDEVITALKSDGSKNSSQNVMEITESDVLVSLEVEDDEEKQALQDKIKYNGMTVMRIGTINQFLQSEPSYIKGKLIRLESVNDDFHMIRSIAEELYKGVFI